MRIAAAACLLTLLAGFGGPVHLAGGGSSAPAYAGICDTIAGGCAEGWSMTRAVTSSYSGPLFQVALYSSPSTTMDIRQTTGHLADMTGVLSFCGGSYGNCAISKMYAQIRGHANDAVPSVFNNAYNGPYCLSAGASLACACPLVINPTTDLPELDLDTSPLIANFGPCEYTLSGDAAAVGITGGSASDTSVLLVGKSVQIAAQCCGAFMIAHAYNAPATPGTDLGLGIQYSNTGAWVNCPSANIFCLQPDIENNINPVGASLGSSPADVVAMVSWAHFTNLLSGVVNGHQAWTPQNPPPARGQTTPITMNPGTRVHFGGGGDLSQPAPFNFFEGILTNSVISSPDYSAALANVGAAYPNLSFP
jgi:hypothetical protein